MERFICYCARMDKYFPEPLAGVTTDFFGSFLTVLVLSLFLSKYSEGSDVREEVKGNVEISFHKCTLSRRGQEGVLALVS